MPFQIFRHALRLRERFVRTASTGNDADGLRIRVQIFDGFVKTVPQYAARARFTHLRAQHHHIIKPGSALFVQFARHATFHRAEHHQANAYDGDQHILHQTRQQRPPVEQYSDGKQQKARGERHPDHPESRAGMRIAHGERIIDAQYGEQREKNRRQPSQQYRHRTSQFTNSMHSYNQD